MIDTAASRYKKAISNIKCLGETPLAERMPISPFLRGSSGTKFQNIHFAGFEPRRDEPHKIPRIRNRAGGQEIHLSQGRNGDPLAPSAHPTYEAKQMQDLGLQ